MAHWLQLTAEEHRARHVELHKALDELFADFIEHHPHRGTFLDTSIRELIRWSCRQTERPDVGRERG